MKTNPYREEADKQLILTMGAKLDARVKSLAAYDTKITIQENIVNGILIRLSCAEASQLPAQASALVANTLPAGTIHVDTMAREQADEEAAQDILEVLPLSSQFDALMNQQRNLDKYEESIALREWAIFIALKNLNKEANSKASRNTPPAPESGNSASESTTPTDPSSPK